MKIDTTTIRRLIEERRRQGVPVRGVWVRNELNARFGVRASTDRIYRLIEEGSAGNVTQPEITQLQARIKDLEAKVHLSHAATLKEQQRANLAEERERAHQEKWALEIDSLRQKLRAAQERGGRYDRFDEQLNLHRDLFAARAMNSRMKDLLDKHGLKLDEESM